MIFQLQIPPSPRKLKLRQILALCDFSVADYRPPPKIKYEIMADLPNGKVCVASYHMLRLYPTRITTRSNYCSTLTMTTMLHCTVQSLKYVPVTSIIGWLLPEPDWLPVTFGGPSSSMYATAWTVPYFGTVQI